MMTCSTYRTRCSSRLLLLAVTLVLVFGSVGCSRVPRKHWWQFWRPNASETSKLYGPDSVILPPPPDALSPDGGKAGEALSPEGSLPTPPTGAEMAEPDPLRRAATKTTSALRTVFFTYDNADLSEENRAVLDGDAAWLQANPNYQIQIEGHCDERGSVEYNMNLGDRRAKTVKAYLMSKGVPGGRLHTISYGEERPLEPAHTEDAWAKNRRVQFLVY